jgi:hypothetical protein
VGGGEGDGRMSERDQRENPRMNWVEAQYQCSMDQVWKKLIEHVKTDFKIFQERFQNPLGLKIEDVSSEYIRIFPQRGGGWVGLKIDHTYIALQRGTSAISDPVVGECFSSHITEKNECYLIYKQEEESFQVDFEQASRLLLERVLFPDQQPWRPPITQKLNQRR